MLSFVQNKHNAVVNFVLIFQGRILQQTQIGNKGIVALYQRSTSVVSKHQPHDLITTNEQHHYGVQYCNR